MLSTSDVMNHTFIQVVCTFEANNFHVPQSEWGHHDIRLSHIAADTLA
ncbi:unnamed protein product [Schistosoma mattheei]|uniref:Uncharacterized protein n=1 Tax=Schistosoma mattheei TaxID=31246 RepID=A0A183NFI4_9TREM|nr:unnamed protein product [Schistosoma mattheei]